jgi:predicted nucleic acid-binding protein
LSGAFEICYDKRILDEYTEVLARPRFQFDPIQVHDILLKIQLDGLSTEPKAERLDLPDPDDEAFLSVALAASADYLVTGNLADYPLEKRRGCMVVSPAEFLSIWKKFERLQE